MSIKPLVISIGKLLLCGLIFALGLLLGGMLVAMLWLPAPATPGGMDTQSTMVLLLVESPLLALVLALLARHLAGGFWIRSLMLFLLTWIANSVNTQIEAAAFAGMAEGFWFTVITFLFPVLLVSMAVAWLFPPLQKVPFMQAARSYFSRHSRRGWLWRLALGSVIFMPIYYFFGLLVIPITRAFYEQGSYGLEIPSIDSLLVILFVRSVLFFLACLPILIAWQGSRTALFWRLGLALFYLVGFQSLLIASWMPWALRLPHMIEILFDEFVYAGTLTWLMRSEEMEQQSRHGAERTSPVHA